ncbi:hypothetical protein K3179_05810 [Qipengyuania sp. GH38]|uniref:hypothetical protein n=1 Tax=Qipengyuania intermedia TaxID=2867244 RepID=UPI001C8741BD|nr:hypothetical protein [Qipengyuania intermedia]MBX7514064.1 hypothetical protein [Qipengyuania intermedia]
MTAETRKRSRPGLWVGLFFASAGVIIALRLSGAIEEPVGFILLALSMGLMIPFNKAMKNSTCTYSEAMDVYNRRMMLCGIGYVLGLGIAIVLWRNYELADWTVFALTLLPILPTLGMIWAMARYLGEESDEYLRYKSMMASLAALAFVLALGIFWGFLEMFELVPHIWAWWVLPAWAIGLAGAQLWQKVRGA